MSLVYREAIRNGDAAANPARLVKQRKESNGRIRFLRPEEEIRLRAAIEELHPDRLDEFVIATRSGMRKSEQYGLERREVRIDDGMIDLTDTKNGDPRMIRMSPEVKRAFTRILAASTSTAPSDPVFKIKDPRDWWGE